MFFSFCLVIPFLMNISNTLWNEVAIYELQAFLSLKNPHSWCCLALLDFTWVCGWKIKEKKNFFFLYFLFTKCHVSNSTQYISEISSMPFLLSTCVRNFFSRVPSNFYISLTHTLFLWFTLFLSFFSLFFFLLFFFLYLLFFSLSLFLSFSFSPFRSFFFFLLLSPRKWPFSTKLFFLMFFTWSKNFFPQKNTWFSHSTENFIAQNCKWEGHLYRYECNQFIILYPLKLLIITNFHKSRWK